MNLDDTERLRGPLQDLLDHASRINANKPERYWYPLSLATYDVEEVLAAVDSLCSFRTTMWDKTATFEREFSELQGRGEAIMVNSGSSAGLLIMLALTNPSLRVLQPGDEVLVPAVTWPSQIWAPMMAGLGVRFVDVDPRTLNIDIHDLERCVTPRTRALSLVHLMGNPCDMDAIGSLCERHDLVLIEDACESLAARWKAQPVGTFGAAANFSFFFSHHITTMEGGMVTTADEQIAEVLRLLRAHGWARHIDPGSVPAGIDPRYTFLNWGLNVRPTELQAAFGSVQLGRLPAFQAARLENVSRFRAQFAHHDLLHLMEVLPGAECSWFALPFMVDAAAPFSRDALVSHLDNQGVETRPIVAGNITRHPVAALFPALQGHDLPGADEVHDRGFYVGVHPFDGAASIGRLLEIIDRYIAQY